MLGERSQGSFFFFLHECPAGSEQFVEKEYFPFLIESELCWKSINHIFLDSLSFKM